MHAPPICRQTAAPSSVGPSDILLFSFSVVLRCVAAKAAFSLLAPSVGLRSRSMQAHSRAGGERGRGRERERGSQAAYQRNFLGVIDRPLPPLLPSPAVRLPSLARSLARSLALSPSFLPSLLSSPDHSRRNPEHSERTNVSCRSIVRANFRGTFCRGRIFVLCSCDVSSYFYLSILSAP